MFYSLLGILILAEGASFWAKGRSSAFFRRLFSGAAILIFGLLSCKSYQQYQIWHKHDISRYLLPPFQSIVYFLKYSFTHFFETYLISLGAGLLFLWLANLLNNRCQKRFFEEGELYLGTLAIFVLGHPLWMFYFLAIMSVGVIGTLFSKVSCSMFHAPCFMRQAPCSTLHAPSRRFPFYYFWLPTAVIIMIIGKILV